MTNCTSRSKCSTDHRLLHLGWVILSLLDNVFDLLDTDLDIISLSRGRTRIEAIVVFKYFHLLVGKYPVCLLLLLLYLIGILDPKIIISPSCCLFLLHLLVLRHCFLELFLEFQVDGSQEIMLDID